MIPYEPPTGEKGKSIRSLPPAKFKKKTFMGGGAFLHVEGLYLYVVSLFLI